MVEDSIARRGVVESGDGGRVGEGIDAAVEKFTDLVGAEGLEFVDFGGLGCFPAVEGLGGEDEIALEVAFEELGDFGAGVGADFVESVDADVEGAAVDQILEEGGVFGVAFEFVLDGFEDAVFAAVGGEVDGVAFGGLDELAEVHGFAESGFTFENELALEAGEGLKFGAVAGADLAGGEVVGVGVLVEQVGVGEEAGAEGDEEAIAQKRNPGEQEADVAQSGDVAEPGVPEEDGLDLGGFWVEEDEGDPEGDVGEEGLDNRGAPFVEGDREVAAEGRATIRLIIRMIDQSCYDFVDVVGDEWLCPVVRLIGFESEFDYGNMICQHMPWRRWQKIF